MLEEFLVVGEISLGFRRHLNLRLRFETGCFRSGFWFEILHPGADNFETGRHEAGRCWLELDKEFIGVASCFVAQFGRVGGKVAFGRRSIVADWLDRRARRTRVNFGDDRATGVARLLVVRKVVEGVFPDQAEPAKTNQFTLGPENRHAGQVDRHRAAFIVDAPLDGAPAPGLLPGKKLGDLAACILSDRVADLGPITAKDIGRHRSDSFGQALRDVDKPRLWVGLPDKPKVAGGTNPRWSVNDRRHAGRAKPSPSGPEEACR